MDKTIRKIRHYFRDIRVGPTPVFPAITMVVFLLPIMAGLTGTLLPAFGYQPLLGSNTFSLIAWQQLINEPGLFTACLISLTTGFGATIIALLMSLAIVITFYDHPLFAVIRRTLAPILAIPHSGFAIGCAFLLAPSGWIFRWVSPEISGWLRPPDILMLQDPGGIALMIVLAFKEVFFLLLMILAALAQIAVKSRLRVTRSMGYSSTMAWIKVILPALYPQIRLPIYAVLVTGLSTVDLALIVGPTAPPTLSVLLLNWFRDVDLQFQFTAAAGAVLRLLLVIASISLFYIGERVIILISKNWLVSGQRRSRFITFVIKGAGIFSTFLVYLISILSLLSMALWAVTRVWRWPQALPDHFTLDNIINSLPMIGQPLLDTWVIGFTVATIALVLAIGCLEYEVQKKQSIHYHFFSLLYLPLLLPQIGFLFGVQTLWVFLNIDGGYVAVIWSHLLFALPFVYLGLADPFRNLDPRIARTARSLGATPLRVLLLIKIPLLLRPVMIAFAIGFSVSVAQYLPTLFAGSSRIVTITTEAINLASGADRRLLGVLVFLQTMLPLLVFIICIAFPTWYARNRKGLSQ